MRKSERTTGAAEVTDWLNINLQVTFEVFFYENYYWRPRSLWNSRAYRASWSQTSTDRGPTNAGVSRSATPSSTNVAANAS